MSQKTRAEHMQWCKDRANEYIKAGDGQQAMSSMISDLRKHPETADSMPMAIALMNMTNAKDLSAVRKYVDGFN